MLFNHVDTMSVDREAWHVINLFLGALDWGGVGGGGEGKVDDTVLWRSDTLVTAPRDMFLRNWV